MKTLLKIMFYVLASPLVVIVGILLWPTALFLKFGDDPDFNTLSVYLGGITLQMLWVFLLVYGLTQISLG